MLKMPTKREICSPKALPKDFSRAQKQVFVTLIRGSAGKKLVKYKFFIYFVQVPVALRIKYEFSRTSFFTAKAENTKHCIRTTY